MAAYELPDLADLFSKLSDDDLVKLYQDLLQELDEIVAERNRSIPGYRPSKGRI